MLTFKGIVEELYPPHYTNNNTAGFTANPVINNLKLILKFFLVYDNKTYIFD